MQEQWARQEAISEDAVQHIRVDFTVDCCEDGEQGERFRKSCDLLIACFKAKHAVKEKADYYGQTQMTMKPKNNKAKYGAFELERYNKGIQQESEEALWRFEIRHMENKNRRRKLYDPAERLKIMQEELLSLPAYYGKTMQKMDEGLIARYEEYRIGL